MELLDEFQVTHPTYLLLRKSSIVFDKKGNATGFAQPRVFIGVVSDTGEVSLPVFTDEDLSKRFLGASAGVGEVVCVFARNDEQLIDYLNDTKDQFPSVVFDPEKPEGWSRRAWPTEYVIKQLTNHEGLR